MKKFMISLAIASIAMVSYAQETVSEVVVPTLKNSVVTNSFWSNWFVSVNGGYQVFNGARTNGESMFDHGTPAVSVNFGKWHTPGFGWRIGYNGWELKSYEDADKCDFYNVHMDMLFNLSNLLCGYNESRIWNAIPYVGLGYGANVDVKGASGNGKAGSLTANFGLLNTFRVAKHWAVNFELSGMMAKNGFGGWASHHNGYDMLFAAQVGVTYKFNRVGWDNAPDVEALQGIYGGMIDGLQNQLDDALAANEEKKNQIKALEDANKALENKVEELSKVKPVSVTESIFFAFDSYKIASKKEELNIKAYAEAAKAAGVKVKVVGFADKVGTDEYNAKLSAKRAEAVAEILRANGVEVEVVAGGESEEYKDRILNRRAVITVAE